MLIFSKNYKKKIPIISCDNLDSNSLNFKKNLKVFIKKKDRKLLKLIDKNFIFLNSMVDRITPKQNLKASQRKKNNLDFIIEAEEYCNWIIETKRKYLIPGYKLNGIKFVKKIKDYQYMKLMMLNASHCSTSFLASLNNNKYVNDTFNNKKFILFIEKYLNTDVIPYLKKNFYNYKNFKNEILSRFSNKFLKDETSRTVENGSTNLSVFIRPSLINCLKKRKSLKRFSLIYASWFVFILKNKSNNWLKLNDANKKIIIKLTKTQKKSVNFFKYSKLLNLSFITKNNQFIKDLNHYINLLKNNKINEALRHASE